jgi:hypothetical protein
LEVGFGLRVDERRGSSTDQKKETRQAQENVANRFGHDQ